jgi:hypothetical protein
VGTVVAEIHHSGVARVHHWGVGGDYTPAERLVLISGLMVDRNTVWSRLPAAVQGLADRGLIEVSWQEHGDGSVDAVPMGLNYEGVRVARALQESSFP